MLNIQYTLPTKYRINQSELLLCLENNYDESQSDTFPFSTKKKIARTKGYRLWFIFFLGGRGKKIEVNNIDVHKVVDCDALSDFDGN